MIQLYAADPRGLPPPVEYDTIDAWLAALPPYTRMIQEFDNGFCVHAFVEDIIDARALGPVIVRRLREYVQEPPPLPPEPDPPMPPGPPR